MTPELGIIEGFFGRPWSWAERTDAVRFLGPRGYGFHIYAPKADPYLRRRWREPYPDAELDALKAFGAACREVDVRFGVGLTPFELHFGFDTNAKVALSAKLAQLDDAGVEDLAILFDDMKGDLPDLAARQAEIVHWIGPRTKASRLIMCPSYYSDDPVLDRVFGARPRDYLAELGIALEPVVHVMWTGEEVCSREYSPGHLERVGQQLRRRPFLWDNYPVNDGPRMSQHLHLRAFTGRPAAIGGHLSAHAVNPASQPILSRIPLLTLLESYARGEGYQYLAAFRRAASEVLGEALAERVTRDLLAFQDGGRDRLSDERRQELVQIYSEFDHPAAREVADWLAGEYAITGEALQTQ
jgi:hyaluronoglucosaminidase